jgi:hypothetical protein
MDGASIKNGVLGTGDGEKRQPEMQEVFQTQKQEANTEFFKFISRTMRILAEPEKFFERPS